MFRYFFSYLRVNNQQIHLFFFLPGWIVGETSIVATTPSLDGAECTSVAGAEKNTVSAVLLAVTLGIPSPSGKLIKYNFLGGNNVLLNKEQLIFYTHNNN